MSNFQERYMELKQIFPNTDVIQLFEDNKVKYEKKNMINHDLKRQIVFI